MATLSPYPRIALSDNSQSNAAWMGWFEQVRALVNNNVLSVDWVNITSKPTTFTGFGISTTSANLAAALTDEYGSGLALFVSGTPDGTKFLGDDATWKNVPSGSSVVPGQDGEDGDDGIPGRIGGDGAAGAAGTSGSNGPPGFDGEDGTDALVLLQPIVTTNNNITSTTNFIFVEGEDGEDAPVIPGTKGDTGAPGGGGGSATTVEVNLGATAQWTGKFTITDATITATSKVLCWQAPGPYTSKGTRADEAELQPVQVIAVEPATGTALVKWQTPPMITFPYNPRVAGTSSTPPALPKDLQQFADRIATRLGKIRGNVKFSYLVFA